MCGKTPLDNTGVHPESYDAAKKLLDLFGYSQNDVATNGASGIGGKVKDYGLAKAAEECGVGTPTLTDIIGELEKPGRDIRDDLPKPMLRSDIMDMNDLKEAIEVKLDNNASPTVPDSLDVSLDLKYIFKAEPISVSKAEISLDNICKKHLIK